MNWERDEAGVWHATDAETKRKFRIRTDNIPGDPETWCLEEQKVNGEWAPNYGARRERDLETVKRAAERLVQHLRELPALHRVPIAPPVVHTIWGHPQHATDYGSGIVLIETARHGGFHLSASARKAMPDALRSPNGWYEEDVDWARVALAFPDRFTSVELEAAHKTGKTWFPDEYEKFTGQVVPLEESHIKQERAFRQEAVDKWVVISALRDDNDPSIVNVYATLGGERSTFNRTVEERRFRIPAAEYQQRSRFGFIIDEARHEEILPDGPRP